MSFSDSQFSRPFDLDPKSDARLVKWLTITRKGYVRLSHVLPELGATTRPVLPPLSSKYAGGVGVEGCRVDGVRGWASRFWMQGLGVRVSRSRIEGFEFWSFGMRISRSLI